MDKAAAQQAWSEWARDKVGPDPARVSAAVDAAIRALLGGADAREAASKGLAAAAAVVPAPTGPTPAAWGAPGRPGTGQNGGLPDADDEDDADSGIDDDIKAEIAESTAQRTPCVLVLDTSGSMRRRGRIDRLNAALREFEAAVKADAVASRQVMLSVVCFGGQVRVAQDWTHADRFSAPVLAAEGNTPLGGAMREAMSRIDALRAELRRNGTPYTRPWIVLMSDGDPTDDWQGTAAECRRACEDGRLWVWAAAIPPEADPKPLLAFAKGGTKAFVVGESQFGELFAWLTGSIGKITGSQAGQTIQLELPATIAMTV